MILKRQNSSDFILGGRGLLKTLAIAAVIIVYKTEAVKPNYN